MCSHSSPRLRIPRDFLLSRRIDADDNRSADGTFGGGYLVSSGGQMFTNVIEAFSIGLTEQS